MTGMSGSRRLRKALPPDVLDQLNVMQTKPQFRGSVILMHDGGGDRSVTVAALPVLIDALRAHGYKFVQVSDLMGKTRAEVMPELKPNERWTARVDSAGILRYRILSAICRCWCSLSATF